MDYKLQIRSDECLPVLLIFSSADNRGHGFEMERYMSSNNSFECHVLYLRDPKKAWFSEGVQGLGHDVDTTVAGIQKVLRGINFSYTITMGSSMGGYAALLFGQLLRSRFVIAFCPQVNMTRETNTNMLYGMMQRVKSQAPYRDITTLDFAVIETIHVVYAPKDKADKPHVDILTRTCRDNVILYPQACLHTENVRCMIRSNKFDDLIRSVTVT